ncbi:MAG: FUSC family protein, partial [Gammaproteobacteria bacterium]
MAEKAAAVPRQVRLQEAFKLALSMTLFYWLALWMNWDLPKFGALAIVVVSLSTTGASLNKGVMRVAGTGLGALAGFVLLSWFAQSPAGMLLGVSVYLTVIGYFMQTSRQGDTWFNAGFIAIAVWSSSYMKVDTAFHFATSRFLETAAGVIIFTLVSMLLWPRTSRQALLQQGRGLWEGMHKLFGMYRRQLQEPAQENAASELRMQLAGTYQTLLATLAAAYADTAAVRCNKKSWELLRIDLQAFGNTQELWRESIADCRELDLGKLLPGLDSTLAIMEARLARGSALWRAQQEPGSEQGSRDNDLLTELPLDIDTREATGLTHLQGAALMNFASQLKALDRTSRELLQTLRVLAGLDPATVLHSQEQKTEPFRPARWNPERLLKALFPALCWVAAWSFWIHVQPPGGPAIPMMATAFGLIVVMAPVNLPGLLLVLLLSMFIFVAPVYLLVMPLLDSGFAILTLIFLYTFCFGFLGFRSPALKLGPLMMFVNMANVTNDQVYSFILLVTGGLVMLIGVSIVVLVHRLLSPMHAEKVLLRTLQRFFQGCARIAIGYTMPGTRQVAAARNHRKRLFENRVLPLPTQLQGIMKRLDYRQFPANNEDRVQDLVRNLYSLRNRLLTVEASYNTAASESPQLLQAILPLQGDWRRRIHDVFNKWARLEPADTLIEEWRRQPELS